MIFTIFTIRNSFKVGLKKIRLGNVLKEHVSPVKRDRWKERFWVQSKHHRASESQAEHEQRLAANQQQETNRRASESEVECLHRLTAGQQRKANCRASETEAEHSQRLAAGQQQEANRRASESEAEHAQRVAANQQQDAIRRDLATDAQRLSSNQEHIAGYRAMKKSWSDNKMIASFMLRSCYEAKDCSKAVYF